MFVKIGVPSHMLVERCFLTICHNTCYMFFEIPAKMIHPKVILTAAAALNVFLS